MDASVQGNSGNHAADSFDEDSRSSCLPEICDVFEDSVLFPRVGEQYQVEIPPVETKSALFQLKPISTDVAKRPSIDKFGIGLSIPVNWVQYAADNIKIKCEKEEFPSLAIVLSMEGSAHLHNHTCTQVDNTFNTRGFALENSKPACKVLQRFVCKDEFLNSSHKDIHVECSANHVMGDNDQNDYCLSFLQSRKAGDFYPFPGLSTQFWSDEEKQSFLLGLYIFGKNLVQVKKFVETKRMGDVLSFYYGNFYRSDAYHRWSECRKIKNRRCIHGQRIFTGWRKQEFLSRILYCARKELQDTLLEATKTFNEGRSTLENFVFKLKAAVGLQVLVEAIGIGKGTHDLTGVALDHVRTNSTIPLHSEIPVGRACSTLTSADIIKFLTGDFRLSKARSNDLFWEAVWPRLLARGWHSEQPRDHVSFSFKNSLVFLVPGVKKFSRKRLVKGTHFFDSVTDVLSKVALDPKLLELDVERVKNGSNFKQENGWDADGNVYSNGSSNHPRHLYLHLRRPSCNSEHMKFTVVDTSLVQKEGSFKVMQVRNLPIGSISSYEPSADTQESRRESSSETEDSDNEDDSNPASFGEKKPEHNQTIQSELPKTLTPFPCAASANGYALGDKCLVRLKDDSTQVRCENRRRVRSAHSNCSAPTIKRRKLTACSKGTDRRTCSVVKSIQRDKQQMNLSEDKLQSQTDHYHNSNNKAENSIVGQTNLSEDKLQSQTLFDLNNLPPDADVAESLSNELKQQVGIQLSVHDDSIDAAVNEQLSTGIRRQSTRNRPPTVKALEALANGLLGTKRSWKPSNSTTKSSRKSRKIYQVPAPATAANLGDVASCSLSMSVAEKSLQGL